jgi:hypothetical protein
MEQFCRQLYGRPCKFAASAFKAQDPDNPDKTATVVPCWGEPPYLAIIHDDHTVSRHDRFFMWPDVTVFPAPDSSICPVWEVVEEAAKSNELEKAAAQISSRLPKEVARIFLAAAAYGFITPYLSNRPIFMLTGLSGSGKTSLMSLVAKIHGAVMLESKSWASIRDLLTQSHVVADDVMEIEGERAEGAIDLILAYYNRQPTAKASPLTFKSRRYHLRGNLWLSGMNVTSLFNLPGGVSRRLQLFALTKQVTPADLKFIEKDIDYYRLALAELFIRPSPVVDILSLRPETALASVYLRLTGEETQEHGAISDYLADLFKRLCRALKRAKAGGAPTVAVEGETAWVKIASDRIVKYRSSQILLTPVERTVSDGNGVVRKITYKPTYRAVVYTPNELSVIFSSFSLPLKVFTHQRAVAVREDQIDEAIQRLAELAGEC